MPTARNGDQKTGRSSAGHAPRTAALGHPVGPRAAGVDHHVRRNGNALGGEAGGVVRLGGDGQLPRSRPPARRRRLLHLVALVELSALRVTKPHTTVGCEGRGQARGMRWLTAAIECAPYIALGLLRHAGPDSVHVHVRRVRLPHGALEVWAVRPRIHLDGLSGQGGRGSDSCRSVRSTRQQATGARPRSQSQSRAGAPRIG